MRSNKSERERESEGKEKRKRIQAFKQKIITVKRRRRWEMMQY
jgi:hypothetical protein